MTVRRSAEPRYRLADEEGGDRLGFATVKDTIDMAIMEAGVECLERTTQVATSPRSEREVLAATRPFTIENRWRSWWCLATTSVIMTGILVIAAMAPWWPARLACSILGALVMVRVFIIYHDFMHGSLLRNSVLAKILLHAYGYLILAPPRSWRMSHNFHHSIVGKVLVLNSGSYPIMTREMWKNSTFVERLRYIISRSPLIILFAYPMVFAWSLTIEPMIDHPRKLWDSIFAVIAHGALIAGLWWWGGPSMAIFAFIVPVAMAATIGAYFFYAQHNYPGMEILKTDEWTNYRASLRTSSFLKLGRIMRWFTGDIGYHHVHHLNLAIPFYRLSEAMAAIPELQHPISTTLRPRDVLACLRLKLWDEGARNMIRFRDAH